MSNEHNENDIVVSVCSITYNHEKYIGQMFDSILAQQCSFKFEIVIGEDCSTDNTRAIIKQYASQYPDIIKPLLPEKNIGAKKNFSNCLKACTGKYIAICEGDDYWIDPHKLQKQVDLLEADAAASFSFTKSYIIDENGNRTGDNQPIPVNEHYTYHEILSQQKCFIPTATLLFRNRLPDPLPYFFTNAISGDIALHLILLSQGYGICIFEETAVYRVHQGGITKSAEHVEHAMVKQFELYELANKHYEYKYKKDFDIALHDFSNTILIYGAKEKKGIKKIKHAFKYFPLYLKYAPDVSIKKTIYYGMVLFAPGLLKLKK